MAADRRKDVRTPCEASIRLVLKNAADGTVLAPPIRGVLDDASRRGGGLRVGQVWTGPYHVFYSPQDNPDIALHLEPEVPEGPAGTWSVPVQVVWMDRVFEGPLTFRLGVKVLSGADGELLRRLRTDSATGMPRP